MAFSLFGNKPKPKKHDKKQQDASSKQQGTADNLPPQDNAASAGALDLTQPLELPLKTGEPAEADASSNAPAAAPAADASGALDLTQPLGLPLKTGNPAAADASLNAPAADAADALDLTQPLELPPKSAAQETAASQAANAAPQAPAVKPAAPVQAKSAAPPSVRAPVSVPRKKRAPDSIMNIEVTSASSELASVIEEAAILFANGQNHDALASLTHAVRAQDLGSSAQQVWLMLFDLYLLLGMKAEFEALGMDFAVKFERSPPIWRESREAIKDPLLLTGGGAYHALTGVLSGESAAQLEKLRRGAEKKQYVRIEFSKLQGVEPSGCKLLIETLAALKKGGNELMVSGQQRLISLLQHATQIGRKSDDPVLWLALLEIFQLLGMQNEYEEAALNYAVTYEVSPPSWEMKPAKAAAIIASPAEDANSGEGTFSMSGELRGNIDTVLEKLADYAGANSSAVVDMAAVKRIDFVSAGALLNLLTRLNQGGKNVQIRGANELIIALFVVMGIHKVARIVRRN